MTHTSNLHPNRTDRIRDKLIGIEMRAHKIEDLAYKARHMESGQEDNIKANIRLIGAIWNELWVILNTPDEKGRTWGWWE